MAPYQRNYMELRTYLDKNGKTFDNVKELENFKKAGELLPEVWSEMTIDGYQVSANWVDPSDERKSYHCFIDSKIVADWLETHIFI